jgi:hypothetical protein
LTGPSLLVASATPDTLPGAVKARQRVTTVTITAWDPATRVVTFAGPNGTSYTRHLLDKDVTLMEGLKVGDRADVRLFLSIRRRLMLYGRGSWVRGGFADSHRFIDSRRANGPRGTPPASAARLVFGRSSFGELEPNPHAGRERNRPPRALAVDVAQVLLDEPIDIRQTVHPTQLGLTHSMLQTILLFDHHQLLAFF